MTTKEITSADEEAPTRGEPEIEIPSVHQGNKAVDSPTVNKPESPPNADANQNEAEVEYPAAFYCPITKKIMVDPVVHPNGASYEKEAIVSRQSAESLLTFYPNRALKAYIERELDRFEEEGSVVGTIRTLDNNLRREWNNFVDRTALPFGESRALPDEFYCTLTLDLFKEPVIDPEGFSYERQAIVHWVQNNGDSPVTRKPLSVDQLRDNNAVLDILLYESEKPEEELHPCIRRWKEELSNPPPSIVPEVTAPNSDFGVTMNGPRVPVIITSSQIPRYPTTHEEMEERRAAEHRRSMISLLLIIVIISFALVYMPFYIVIFAAIFCSCLYARHKLRERRHYYRQ